MQGHWISSAPYYRCRFPNEYALANKISHPRNVYLREDAFDAQVTDWLATALAPGRLDETIDQMTAAQPAADDGTQSEAAREKIADAGLKMAATKQPSKQAATRPRSAHGSPKPKRSASRPGPS